MTVATNIYYQQLQWRLPESVIVTSKFILNIAENLTVTVNGS